MKGRWGWKVFDGRSEPEYPRKKGKKKKKKRSSFEHHDSALGKVFLVLVALLRDRPFGQDEALCGGSIRSIERVPMMKALA
ncbi:hypothetical protein Tco_0398041 [Tanacetum coccineum]